MREHYLKESTQSIAEHLGRSVYHIHNRAILLGLTRKPQLVGEKVDQALEMLRRGEATRTIADTLRVTQAAVRALARRRHIRLSGARTAPAKELLRPIVRWAHAHGAGDSQIQQWIHSVTGTKVARSYILKLRSSLGFVAHRGNKVKNFKECLNKTMLVMQRGGYGQDQLQEIFELVYKRGLERPVIHHHENGDGV